jgi:ABC-type multidrug transport system fused ATPase/permease subunit
MFAGTIRQNIALGRDGASDADIEAAAVAAGALSFIEALPLGWDTQLAERGSTLSGGQLQRISIARAILKDAPILILDEATSALDGETERHVHAALRRLMAGRTTLLIAHRRSTVETADRALVLVAGRIEAEGSNDELSLHSPSYRQLFDAAPAAQGGDSW